MRILEKEEPVIWQKLGSPKRSYFGQNSDGKELGDYLHKREYRNSDNQKVVRAGRWIQVSNYFFCLTAIALVYYYLVTLLFHK